MVPVMPAVVSVIQAVIASGSGWATGDPVAGRLEVGEDGKDSVAGIYTGTRFLGRNGFLRRIEVRKKIHSHGLLAANITR